MPRRLSPVAAALVVAALSSVPVFLSHPARAEQREAAGRLESQAETVDVHLWHRGMFLNAAAEDLFLDALAARQQQGQGSGCGGDWECFKACTQEIESHGDYSAVSSDGTYRGAYQYNQAFWDGQATEAGRPDLVGTDPATASAEDQDYIAQHTYSTRGNDPWMGRC